MKMDNKTFGEHAAIWVFPFLTFVLGWLIKDKLDSIDRRLSKLENNETKIFSAVKDIEAMEARLNRIEPLIINYYRKPDEIELPKPKKKIGYE
jgi:hypothetical protein